MARDGGKPKTVTQGVTPASVARTDALRRALRSQGCSTSGSAHIPQPIRGAQRTYSRGLNADVGSTTGRRLAV